MPETAASEAANLNGVDVLDCNGNRIGKVRNAYVDEGGNVMAHIVFGKAGDDADTPVIIGAGRP